MRLLPTAAGAVVLAGAVATAGAWLIGERIESHFHKGIAAITETGLDAHVLRYRKGIFSAEAETIWTIDQGDDAKQFTTRHVITHGPFPKGNFAEIRSELVPSEAFASGLGVALQGRPPLEVLTRVHWNGDHDHRIESPELNGKVDDAGITWGGLSGNFDVSADDGRTVGRIDAPLLLVHDDNGTEFRVETVELVADTVRAPGYRFSIGPLGGSIALIAARKGSDGSTLEIRDFRLSGDSHVENDLVQATTSIGAKRISMDGHAVDDFEVAMTAGHLDAETLDLLTRHSEAFAGRGLTPIEQGEELMAAMMTQIPALLSRSPFIKVDRISGRVPEGAFSLRAGLAWVGGNDPAEFNPLTDVAADIGIDVPKSLLARVIGTQERKAIGPMAAMYGWSEDSEMFDNAVEDSVQARLQKLIEQGVIVGQGDNWVSEARYENGQLSLNQAPADALLVELLGPMLR